MSKRNDFPVLDEMKDLVRREQGQGSITLDELDDVIEIVNNPPKCDLCNETGDLYTLCQEHLDIMRFPDTFKCLGPDAEIPSHRRPILVEDANGTLWPAYYNSNYGQYFQAGGPAINAPRFWCEQPDLSQIWKSEHRLEQQHKTGEKPAHDLGGFVTLKTGTGRNVTLSIRKTKVQLLGNLEHCTELIIDQDLVDQLQKVIAFQNSGRE